jgi:hypothetical protein
VERNHFSKNSDISSKADEWIDVAKVLDSTGTLFEREILQLGINHDGGNHRLRQFPFVAHVVS